MHRAGIDGAGARRRLRGFWPEVFFRLGCKSLAATHAAEEMILPLMGETVFCGGALDAHAADGIDGCVARVVAVFAAAAGVSMGAGAVMMAGMSRVCAIRLIELRHEISPGLLNYIP
jgi:hypothetical protein